MILELFHNIHGEKKTLLVLTNLSEYNISLLVLSCFTGARMSDFIRVLKSGTTRLMDGLLPVVIIDTKMDILIRHRKRLCPLYDGTLDKWPACDYIYIYNPAFLLRYLYYTPIYSTPGSWAITKGMDRTFVL